MSRPFDQISLSLSMQYVCPSLPRVSPTCPFAVHYIKDRYRYQRAAHIKDKKRLSGVQFRASVSSAKSMKKDGDEMKVDLSANSGNKVLPVSDQATRSIMSYKKESVKGEIKSKALSRMKELLKWAASPKADKPSKFMKALHFRNHPSVKAVKDERGGDDDDDDDEGSIESPKISLRWDAESCYKISSAFSSVSAPSFDGDNDNSNANSSLPRFSASKRANWITTDSDFVVLELLRQESQRRD